MDDLTHSGTNQDTWPVPAGLWVEGDSVRWAWLMDKRANPSPDLLRDFLRLGRQSPGRARRSVERIAREVGPLTLCGSASHGWMHPLPHFLGTVPDAAPWSEPMPLEERSSPRESVQAWVGLSAELGAALRLASDLAEGVGGSPDDWGLLLPAGLRLQSHDAYLARRRDWEKARPGWEEALRAAYIAGEIPEEPPELPKAVAAPRPLLGGIDEQRERLARYLAAQARHGHVTLSLAWTDEGWRAQPVAGCLHGFLVLAVLALVLRGSRLCSRCLARAASRKQGHVGHPLCARCQRETRRARGKAPKEAGNG